MNADLERILFDEMKLDRSAVLSETSLESAGIDSLSLVELSVSLSDQLGLEISEEELQGAATVGELVAMVEQRRGGG